MIPSTPSPIRYPIPPLMPTDPLFDISKAIDTLRTAFRQHEAENTSITHEIKEALVADLVVLEHAIRNEDTLDLDLLNEVIDLIEEIERAGNPTTTYVDKQSDWSFRLGDLHGILNIFNSHPDYEIPSKVEENAEVTCYIEPTNISTHKIWGTFNPRCSAFLLTKKSRT